MGYSIGPGTDRPLCLYWDHLIRVAWVEQYYSALLQGLRGVAQGDHVSPTICNMVLDVVICHQVILGKG